jgi:peptide deformylase
MAWTRARRRKPVTYLLGEPVEEYPATAPEVHRGRVLRITEIGEPVLHNPARTVDAFSTPELARLIDDLFATMESAQGVGRPPRSAWTCGCSCTTSPTRRATATWATW